MPLPSPSPSPSPPHPPPPFASQILFPLSHPNVVRYFASFIHTDFVGVRNYCMVMELCSGGTLKDLTIAARTARTPFPECQIGIWVNELLSALAYLHSQVCVCV